MKWKLWSSSILLILITTCLAAQEPSLNVMAYYVPAKDYPPEKLPLEKLTHIILSFAVVVDGEMQFTNDQNPDYLNRLVQLRDNQFPELKVMVACGGWGADGFSDAAYNDSTRIRFIASAEQLIRNFQIDGIDMDWEYPAIPAAGTRARDEDKENFTLLMKGLREMMDQTDRPQTLTFASAGWTRYYDNIELDEVMQYANYMNVMTYDQVGGNSIYTGHHTPLGKIDLEDLRGTAAFEVYASRNRMPGSVEYIVEYCIGRGIDPKQIIIGAAFYGRAWKGVPPDRQGLYQLSKGVYLGWTDYSNIQKDMEGKNGYVEYWDPDALAPYLYNSADSIFVSYDSPRSVGLKTQYAVDNQLGGIMFWQLSNDSPQFDLLEAIWEVVE